MHGASLPTRSLLVLALGGALVGACGDNAAGPADAGAAIDAVVADSGPPPCVHGAVSGACLCGGAVVVDGFCCAGVPAATACAAAGCLEGAVEEVLCLRDGAPGLRARACTSGAWGDWGDCAPDPEAPPILGAVHYVSSSGPDVVDDAAHGSDEAPWRTVQYAVDQLEPGETLMVRRGIYTQTVTIHASGTAVAPITVRAEVPGTAKLAGGLTIAGDHVTVYGLDVEQPSAGTGIVIGDVVGARVLRNHVHDCPRIGISIAAATTSDYRIAGNTLAYDGQIGIRVGGTGGVVEDNRILEVVAFHPKLATVVISDGDDADGMVLRGSGHAIRRNLIANYADPRDTHNYYLPDPVHNAHADCFDTRELSDTVIEGNDCWSGFHVSKGLIFNESAVARGGITVRNNVFEYRDIGISAYARTTAISDLFIHNNLVKARLDDVIDSYLNPGGTADIPGEGIRLSDVGNYAVFNNLTVDCDNHTAAGVTGPPIVVAGGSGVVDYNFSWNSDGSNFAGASAEAHGALGVAPGFEAFDAARAGASDFRLAATSALIGLGADALLDSEGTEIAVLDDLLGEARPEGGASEPGPYERTGAPPRPRRAGISAHIESPLLTLTPTSCAAPASPISIDKAKWRGDRAGALVIQFDDGTAGQALCGLRALGARGLRGTWYINPGNDGYGGTVNGIALASRWAEAPALGQELANHTMHHTQVTGHAAWDAEVGDAAEVIWGLRHGLPLRRHASLMAFNNSSSVAWSWAPREKVAILAEWESVDRQTYLGPAYHVGANFGFSVPAGSTAAAMYCGRADLAVAAGECVDGGGAAVSAGVPRAIAESVVYTAALHGVLSDDADDCPDYTSGATDGGVGGVALDELEGFLDLVAAREEELWVVGAIELFKYAQEQQRANVRLHQACADRVYFDLASPLGPLYDEPLTLLVTVPSDWSSCGAAQGGRVLPCVIRPDGKVAIDVVPDQGRVLLVRSP